MPRLLFSALLGSILGFPLFVLIRRNLSLRSFEQIWTDPEPFGRLLANTFALMVLVILLAVPPGAAFAFALTARGVRGRRWLGTGVIASLFVPLPVWAVSWQILFGELLPPLALEPGDVAWRPWKLGMLPAAWIHAVAAVPWVAGLVWLALQTSDPALDEEARQTGGPRGHLRWVLFPRLAPALALAAAWVALQAGTEIAVTDAMMVRTFAEEAYTQMVVRSSGLGGAIAATAPVWLGTVFALGLLARLGLRRFGHSIQTLGLGKVDRGGATLRATLLAWSPFALYLGLPVGALVWKAAGGGVLPAPSSAEFGLRLEKVIRTEWPTLLDSLAAAALAGIFTAGLAWIACALGFGAPRYRIGLLIACLVLVALPGPILGFALKQATVELVSAEQSVLRSLDLRPDFPPLRSLLYDQPSPLPGIWVAALRFFPLACGMLAVAMGRIPRSLLEAAAVERRGVLSRWRWVIAPLTARAFLMTALAVAALALGEVSAGKLAQPPARGVFILRLFDQMHYGAESTVAGFCLLQLVATWGILCVLVGLKPERTP